MGIYTDLGCSHNNVCGIIQQSTRIHISSM